MFANASLRNEDDLRRPQRTINAFVNKKHITSGNTIYLSKKRGGTDTFNLYKCGWIPKLVHEERRLVQCPTYHPAPWADPILTLMKAFRIKFRHLAYAGEADIQHTANICRDHGLLFWEHMLNEYRNILRECNMNGNMDAKAKQKFENSGTKWLGTRVIGSHYIASLRQRSSYKGKFHSATDIPDISATPYDGPSITNPNTALILRDQLNTLGTFLGQTGTPRIKRRSELEIHPLYNKDILTQHTVNTLIEAT